MLITSYGSCFEKLLQSSLWLANDILRHNHSKSLVLLVGSISRKLAMSFLSFWFCFQNFFSQNTSLCFHILLYLLLFSFSFKFFWSKEELFNGFMIYLYVSITSFPVNSTSITAMLLRMYWEKPKHRPSLFYLKPYFLCSDFRSIKGLRYCRGPRRSSWRRRRPKAVASRPLRWHLETLNTEPTKTL